MRPAPLPDDELDRLVERAVAAGVEPLAVAAIARALPAGLRPARPALAAALERLARAGRLHPWPKGKGVVWSRRPFHDEVRERLVIALGPEPRPLKDLKRLLGAAIAVKGVAVPPEALAQAIAELEQAGRAHRWPTAKAGAWATRSFDDVLEGRIAASLQEQPRTEAEVQKAVGKVAKGAVSRALHALLASGRVHRHPALGKKARYGARPASAVDYVGPVLARALAELEALGFTEPEIRRAMAAQLGSAHPVASPADDSERILAAMVELNPKVREGDVIYVPHLRTALAAALPDKAGFDRAMLGLLVRDRITMHSHPAPAQLPEAEREAMVPDGRGSYYMVAGLRS